MTFAMRAWIRRYIGDVLRGRCFHATDRMALAFPQLRRVRGHYHAPGGAVYPHWWLVTPNGEIVDPTKAQFQPRGTYVEDVAKKRRRA